MASFPYYFRTIKKRALSHSMRLFASFHPAAKDIIARLAETRKPAMKKQKNHLAAQPETLKKLSLTDRKKEINKLVFIHQLFNHEDPLRIGFAFCGNAEA
jgi:hypothetical protein